MTDTRWQRIHHLMTTQGMAFYAAATLVDGMANQTPDIVEKRYGNGVEWQRRVQALLRSGKVLSFRGASTVVDAAMFGEGCLEGEVRAQIEREGRGEKTNVVS